MQTQLVVNRLPVVAATSSGNSGKSPVASTYRLIYLASPAFRFPIARWRPGHAGFLSQVTLKTWHAM